MYELTRDCGPNEKDELIEFRGGLADEGEWRLVAPPGIGNSGRGGGVPCGRGMILDQKRYRKLKTAPDERRRRKSITLADGLVALNALGAREGRAWSRYWCKSRFNCSLSSAEVMLMSVSPKSLLPLLSLLSSRHDQVFHWSLHAPGPLYLFAGSSLTGLSALFLFGMNIWLLRSLALV
jgi:hypothetical protein